MLTSPGATDGTALLVRDLAVRFGQTEAVRNVSFRVMSGERVGLIGPSGAGKTSVLNAVAGMIPYSGGDIVVLGANRAELNERDRRSVASRVGMVHQQLLLTPRLRVLHNVNAGRLGDWSTARSLYSFVRPQGVSEVEVALARVGIADKMRSRTDTLSGGEQQRAALARVLIQKPDLFLADEPVSAVDPSWGHRVLEELSHEVRTRNAALLVVLHDVDLAQMFCDRLIGIRSGTVVFDLPASDVAHGQFASLYELAPTRV